MTPRSRSLALFGFAAVALLVCAALGLWARRLAAQPHGVRWQALTVPQALAAAKAGNKRVLLKFDASWCPSCKALDREVLSTRDGEKLAAGLIAIRFDFDDEATRPLVERYVVMTLPLVLVIGPDGTQIARISGYETREQWVKELTDALGATDPMPALRAAYERAPDDAHAAMLLGEALLARGEPELGEALLDRVTWMQGKDEDKAQALFTLGRYHQRVRKDARSARHIWRDLATRFPQSEWAQGAWSWYAKAEAELGHPEVGVEALRSRVRRDPRSPEAAAAWASFVLKHKLDAQRAPALAALRAVVDNCKPDERDELVELIDKLTPHP